MLTFEALLDQVPRDAEQEVQRAVNRARAAVRDALRAECRLSLNPGGEDGAEREQRIRLTVDVDPAIPVAFKQAHLPAGYERAMALLPFSQLLGALAGEGEALAHVAWRLNQMPEGLPAGLPPDVDLYEFLVWVRAAKATLDQFDPLKAVLNVDEDVLGAYRFGRSAGNDHARILLYWAPIGFVAKQLGCPLDDLTVVTLAHEYAHAFTHLGADIDAARWDTTEFAKADRPLAEGLAQYYTWRALMRLRQRYPGAIVAFHRLMKHQHVVYRNHEEWATRVPVEAVRQALLEVRRAGHRTLTDFIECLKGAVDRVPRVRHRIIDDEDPPYED